MFNYFVKRPQVITIALLILCTTIEAKKSSFKIVPAKNTSYTTVIFDVGDVLVTTSSKSKASLAAKSIASNPFTLVTYVYYQSALKDEFFKELQKIPALSKKPMYNQGKRMPQIMADWMIEIRPSIDIYNDVVQSIQSSKRSSMTKHVLTRIAQLTFIPQDLANSQKVIEPMKKLVKELKKKGYKTYVLSNFSKDGFYALKRKHYDLFKLFDGIVISGEEKMGKPDLEFYKVLLKRYHLNPQKCIFIDDEPYNIQAAQTLGIYGIVRTSDEAVFKQLHKIGVLKHS